MKTTLEAGKAYFEGTKNSKSDIEIHEMIFKLAKKLNLHFSKTFYSYDSYWKELHFKNKEGDDIFIFFKDDRINSMYVYLEDTKFRQFDFSYADDNEPVFNSGMLKTIELFKNNS